MASHKLVGVGKMKGDLGSCIGTILEELSYLLFPFVWSVGRGRVLDAYPTWSYLSAITHSGWPRKEGTNSLHPYKWCLLCGREHFQDCKGNLTTCSTNVLKIILLYNNPTSAVQSRWSVRLMFFTLKVTPSSDSTSMTMVSWNIACHMTFGLPPPPPLSFHYLRKGWKGLCCSVWDFNFQVQRWRLEGTSLKVMLQFLVI